MPHMFSSPDGRAPEGLWDPSKATSQFQGELAFTGGSLPEEGKSPFDTHQRPVPGSAQSFYGAPTQGDTFGGAS